MAKDKLLSTEDRILWGKVARSAKPLPGRMEELETLEALFTPESTAALPAEDIGTRKKSDSESGGIRITNTGKGERQHHPLERPVRRKLAKGRLALEARIDLHGMIQSEAHGLLLSFMLQAHARGMRHVLVITGKGASIGSDGALKRAVPLWFSLPEFRPLISSYEPAARNHGGEGALYVRLARAKGARE
ncbi:DNA-nicking Smr family endonuclease [Rhizobium subbaraonis]|uniref:DNA-nicking Smr family endonuclease n=1 Tax=Rhizobium subbaraonis TaxID=908946 RepID=A0A285U5K3_9HYPH|nr:Smr/MutS family protein [Rhizobium subbaraonis]SOC37224.1 DNA-nicking Smr family endonuclease [Rhizobium subbaraonis]